jgi:hypothetical protein
MSQTINTASFDGTGFLELDSQGLRSNSSLGFTFRTTRDIGLILVSSFRGRTDSESKDFYSIAVFGGKLVFIFGTGDDGDDVQFETRQKYNDGAQHTVSVLRRQQT